MLNSKFCTFICIITILFTNNNAYADEVKDFSILDLPDKNSNTRTNIANNTGIINADSFEYDDTHNMFVASGNVEIIHGKKILLADEVYYDQENHIVKATGNVALMDIKGNVIFADDIILDDDFKDAIIINFAIRFSDDSLLAASKAEKHEDNMIYLDHVVYSPCQIDENDPESDPQWQIKARKVKVDENNQKISYEHARFEFFGVPILYTPYFSHPMPNASKRSGFLVPTYSHNTYLGNTIKLPYYINLASNIDATITPLVTTERGTILNGEFRHLIPEGSYEVKGSLRASNNGDDKLKGHIEGVGYFSLDNGWNLGFSAIKAPDKQYLNLYQINKADSLTSLIYVDKINNRDYTNAELITFQGLNEEDKFFETPIIFPHIYNYKYYPLIYKGANLDLTTDLLFLKRINGTDSNRFIITSGVNLPHITKSGHYLNIKGQLRGDLYYSTDVVVDNIESDEVSVRGIPELELNWRYPMLRNGSHTQVFLEPMLNFIVSPNDVNLAKIPNEDSQNFELYDDNIFSSNRYTGFDRAENGTRVNYGLQGSVYDQANNKLSFVLGQSYQNQVDRDFAAGSGLETKFSDVVGRVSFMYDEYLDLTYRFRIDKNDFNFHRNELFSSINIDPFRLSVNYINIDRDSIFDKARREIYAAMGIKLTQSWTIYGNTRRDLSENGGTISNGIGFDYDGGCLDLRFAINEEFGARTSTQPEHTVSYLIKIFLKNLN